MPSPGRPSARHVMPSAALPEMRSRALDTTARTVARAAAGLLGVLVIFSGPGCGGRYPALVTASPDKVVIAYQPEQGIPGTTKIAQKACADFGAVPEYVAADERVVEYRCVAVHISNEWDPRGKNR
jgi:hypothetical protein